MAKTPVNPSRWAPDPTGRHEYRYWDGSEWTQHVSDGGVQGTDSLEPTAAVPPTSQDAPATTAAAASAAASVPAVTPASVTVPAPATMAAPRGVTDPTAVLGRRYGAFFVDLVISLVVFAALFFPLATRRSLDETLRLPGCHLSSGSSSQVECDNRAVFQLGDTVYEAHVGAFVGLAVAFTLLYFGILEGATGATLGKRATGIRVVGADGSIVGVPRSLIRWLLFAVDGPLTLFLGGVVSSSVSKGHRRLGDMAAETYVVDGATVGQPVAP